MMVISAIIINELRSVIIGSSIIRVIIIGIIVVIVWVCRCVGRCSIVIRRICNDVILGIISIRHAGRYSYES